MTFTTGHVSSNGGMVESCRDFSSHYLTSTGVDRQVGLGHVVAERAGVESRVTRLQVLQGEVAWRRRLLHLLPPRLRDIPRGRGPAQDDLGVVEPPDQVQVQARACAGYRHLGRRSQRGWNEEEENSAGGLSANERLRSWHHHQSGHAPFTYHLCLSELLL